MMSKETDMTETTEYDNGDGEDTVARLMHLAGPRAAISHDIERRVEARVRRECQQATQRRRHLVRWAMPLALAASVLVAVGVNLYVPTAPEPAPVLGTVARVIGTAGGTSALPAIGGSIRLGDTLATGFGESVSVTLRDGVSLRLAPDSELRFDAAGEFSLLAGELYADTGQSVYRADALSVQTPLGTVTDIGTQFDVRYREDNLLVAVREGRVDVAAHDATHTAAAGEMLRLRPGARVETSAVAAHDELWAWAMTVAPVYDIDNRSLMEFLTWAARETGRKLEFAGNEQQMAAMRAVLHGSIDDFTPDEAIDSVLATSGFEYRVTQESIYIDGRQRE